MEGAPFESKLPARGERMEYGVNSNPDTRLSYDIHVQSNEDGQDNGSRLKHGSPRKNRQTSILSKSISSEGGPRVSDLLLSDDGSQSTEVEYRIESVLFRKTMPHTEWREYLSMPKYQSGRLKRGSMWLVPDDVWYDDSEYARTNPVTRYLVKWKNLSYLHCSWELSEDIINTSICGVAASVKGLGDSKSLAEDLLRQVDEAVTKGKRLFPDLRPGEYFPPEWIQIEKILGFSDHPDNLTTNNNLQPLKMYETVSPSAPRDFHSGLPASLPVTSLHQAQSKMLIKWRGLDYAMISLESAGVLQSCGVEYQEALKDYLRRLGGPAGTLDQESIWAIPLRSGAVTKGPPTQEKDETATSRLSNAATISVTGHDGTAPLVTNEVTETYRYVFPNGNQLLPHQTQALVWLMSQYRDRKHCVICDEKGLGRTTLIAAFTFVVQGYDFVKPNMNQYEEPVLDNSSGSSSSVGQSNDKSPSLQTKVNSLTGGSIGVSQSSNEDPVAAAAPMTNQASQSEPPPVSGSLTPSVLVICGEERLSNLDREIASWSGRCPIVLNHSKFLQDSEKLAREYDLLFDGGLDDHAPVVLITVESLLKADSTLLSETKIRSHPWSAVIWFLGSCDTIPEDLPQDPSTNQMRNKATLGNRAAALNRISTFFRRVQWWCMVRSASLHNTFAGSFTEVQPHHEIILPAFRPLSAITKLCSAPVKLYDSTPNHFTPFGSIDAEAIEYISSTMGLAKKGKGKRKTKVESFLGDKETTVQRKNARFRHPDTDFTDVVPLNATASGLIPAYLVRPPESVSCLTLDVDKYTQMEASVAPEDGESVAKKVLLSTQEAKVLESTYTYGIISEKMPQRDPTVLPVLDDHSMLLEELWLIFTFLYPKRYPTLYSLETALQVERSVREENMRKTIDRYYADKTGEVPASSDLIDMNLTLLYEIPQGGDRCHGEHALSPFHKSCLNPVNVPVLSRSYTQIMVPYFRQHKYYLRNYKCMPNRQTSIADANADDFIWLYHSMGRESFDVNDIGSGNNRGCYVRIPTHQSIGRVHSYTASILLTPLQSRVLLRLWLSRHFMRLLSNFDSHNKQTNEEVVDSAKSNSLLVGKESIVEIQDLLTLVRRVSMDAGLVSRSLSGMFGSVIWKDSATRSISRSLNYDGGLEGPDVTIVEEADERIAASNDIDDLCACSGKLEYLRTLIETRGAGTPLKPTVIVVQYRDAADRIEYLLTGMNISFARIDDSSETQKIQREVASFCDPPLFSVAASSEEGSADSSLMHSQSKSSSSSSISNDNSSRSSSSNNSSSSSSNNSSSSSSNNNSSRSSRSNNNSSRSSSNNNSSRSSSSSDGPYSSTGGKAGSKGPNCDVMIVGVRKGTAAPFSGLGSVVRRAKLFILYDGISDEIGRDAESKLLRTIHTLRNVSTVDEIDDFENLTSGGAASAARSINRHCSLLPSNPNSPMDQVSVVRLVVSDSVENIMLRALREKRETNGSITSATDSPKDVSSNDSSQSSAWTSKLRQLSSEEPPTARELLERTMARGYANEEYMHYAHEALDGVGLGNLIRSTTRTVVYPPKWMVSDELQSDVSTLMFTLRQSALLTLIAARRNCNLTSVFGEKGAPASLRLSGELGSYHESANLHRKPVNSNASQDDGDEVAELPPLKKGSRSSKEITKVVSACTIDIDLTAGVNDDSLEDSDDDEDDGKIQTDYDTFKVTDEEFWVKFTKFCEVELRVAESIVNTSFETKDVSVAADNDVANMFSLSGQNYEDNDVETEHWRHLVAPYNPTGDNGELSDGSDHDCEDGLFGEYDQPSIGRKVEKDFQAELIKDALLKPLKPAPRLVVFDELGVPIFVRHVGQPLFLKRKVLSSNIERVLLNPPVNFLTSKGQQSLVIPGPLRRLMVWSTIQRHKMKLARYMNKEYHMEGQELRDYTQPSIRAVDKYNFSRMVGTDSSATTTDSEMEIDPNVSPIGVRKRLTTHAMRLIDKNAIIAILDEKFKAIMSAQEVSELQNLRNCINAAAGGVGVEVDKLKHDNIRIPRTHAAGSEINVMQKSAQTYHSDNGVNIRRARKDALYESLSASEKEVIQSNPALEALFQKFRVADERRRDFIYWCTTINEGSEQVQTMLDLFTINAKEDWDFRRRSTLSTPSLKAIHEIHSKVAKKLIEGNSFPALVSWREQQESAVRKPLDCFAMTEDAENEPVIISSRYSHTHSVGVQQQEKNVPQSTSSTFVTSSMTATTAKSATTSSAFATASTPVVPVSSNSRAKVNSAANVSSTAVHASKNVKEVSLQMLNSLTMERVWTKLTVLRMSHWETQSSSTPAQGNNKDSDDMETVNESIGNANVHVQNDARFVEAPPYDIPLIPKGRTDDESHFLKVGRMLSIQSRDALIAGLLRYGYGRWELLFGAHPSMSMQQPPISSITSHSLQGFYANSNGEQNVAFHSTSHVPYWTDIIMHTLILTACWSGKSSIPPTGDPNLYETCSNIKLHCFETLNPQRLWRLLQHSVIIRYYCHKILQEIEALASTRDERFDPEEADSGAVVGVAVRKMKGINPKDVNLERLGISEALDYLTGFPYYRWKAASMEKVCPDYLKPSIISVLKVLKANYNERFPVVVRSPFFISRLRWRVNIRERGLNTKIDEAAPSLFLHRKQPTYCLEDDRLSEIQPMMVSVICERLDRHFEAYALFNLHRHFNISPKLGLDIQDVDSAHRSNSDAADTAGPARDKGEVTGHNGSGNSTDRHADQRKPKKNMQAKNKRRKGKSVVTEREEEQSAGIEVSQPTEGGDSDKARATYLLSICREHGDKQEGELAPRHRLDYAFAPSLLLSLLIYPSVSKHLARGRLPLGTLMGSAQDFAVIVSLVQDGWPEQIARDPASNPAVYRRLSLALLDSPISFDRSMVDDPMHLEQAQDLFAYYDYNLCIFGRETRSRIRGQCMFSNTTWALSESLWFSKRHLPKCVREHLAFLETDSGASTQEKEVFTSLGPSTGDKTVNTTSSSSSSSILPDANAVSGATGLMSFSTLSSILKASSDRKCDTLVSVLDLSRRARHILGTLMFTMVKTGLYVSENGDTSSDNFEVLWPSSSETNNLLSRCLTGLHSLLHRVQRQVERTPETSFAFEDMYEYTTAKSLGGMQLNDILNIPSTESFSPLELQTVAEGGPTLRIQRSNSYSSLSSSSLASNPELARKPTFNKIYWSVSSEHRIVTSWSPRCFERRLLSAVMRFGIPHSTYNHVQTDCLARFTIEDFVNKGDFTVTELPLVLVGLSYILYEVDNRIACASYELRDDNSTETSISISTLTKSRPMDISGIDTPLHSLMESEEWMPKYLEKYSTGVRAAQLEAPHVDKEVDLQSQSQSQSTSTSTSKAKTNCSPSSDLETLAQTLHNAFIRSAASSMNDEVWSLPRWDQTLRKWGSCELIFRLNLPTYKPMSQYNELKVGGSPRNNDTEAKKAVSKSKNKGKKEESNTKQSKIPSAPNVEEDHLNISNSIEYLNSQVHTAIDSGVVVHRGRREHLWGGGFDKHGDEVLGAAEGSDEGVILNPVALSAETLRRTINLIDTVRLVVLCDRIPDDLQSIAAVAGQLPVWWTVNHTQLLFKGICKHGWRNWDEIIYDKSLGWRQDLPEEWLQHCLFLEITGLPSLYGDKLVDEVKGKGFAKGRDDLLNDNVLQRKVIEKIELSGVPNSPMALLLRSISPQQFENVVWAIVDNYVESLLSWCAPAPPSKKEYDEHGDSIELLPSPNAFEIIHFYNIHKRFPSHADCKRVSTGTS